MTKKTKIDIVCRSPDGSKAEAPAGEPFYFETPQLKQLVTMISDHMLLGKKFGTLMILIGRITSFCY